MRSGAFSEHEQPAPAAPSDGRWRVSPGFMALKCAMTVVLAIAAVFFAEDTAALSAAIVATAVAGGYALRDVLAPVRLAADAHGLTVVAGYAGHRRVEWSQVERVRVESRSRGGLRGELLEIDTGDTLHLLSTYDLNARPADVAEELDRIRTIGGSG
ncbi:PH domain-containing protein [Dactylosporangium salmoneum]|uniref:Low molecular weight protein antigen 6 PH domain-containing protein n=1 Tax=Dactylosporangium salmoneum TaxID=53361 RepID=A0ABP5U6J2_9ACTN